MTTENFGRKCGNVSAHPARIDDVVAAVRADAITELKRTLLRDPPQPPLKASECLLDRRLEEEIDYARRMIEAAGDALADDPITLQRHHVTMQSFDIVGQLLGHLAKVVGCEDRQEAAARIGMTELRNRLLRPESGISQGSMAAGLNRSDSNPFAGY